MKVAEKPCREAGKLRRLPALIYNPGEIVWRSTDLTKNSLKQSFSFGTKTPTNQHHGYLSVMTKKLNFWLKLNGRNARIATYCYLNFIYFLRSICKKPVASVYILIHTKESAKVLKKVSSCHHKNLKIFWMNNKTIIIEFGFCMMWRVMEISSICIILHIIPSLIQ